MAQCHAQQGNSLSDKPEHQDCGTNRFQNGTRQKIFKKKTLNMSHSPLSTYSLGWIKDTTKYSETLIDKIVVCRDIS